MKVHCLIEKLCFGSLTCFVQYSQKGQGRGRENGREGNQRGCGPP